MAERSNQLWVAAGAVIFVGFLTIGLAYRFLIMPLLQDDLIGATSANSQYNATVTLQLDSFSGYAHLRSREFETDLRDQGIKLELVDDGADYEARLRALKRGQAQMAVFTIDALVAQSYAFGDAPATVVSVIDETYGADAIVAYKQGVPSLSALNDGTARVALTPSSPSEFLTRVAIAEFGLNDMPKRWLQQDGAEAVYNSMRKAKRTDRRAFVMWEPFVSKALQDPDAHVLFDSSQLSGYIVDVLVVERQFLLDHPDVVQNVVEASLRSLYTYQARPDGMVDLVVADAKSGGEKLSNDQARSIVQGIRWRNTLENYTHMGLAQRQPGILHLEDSVSNIGGVLQRTGAVSGDPTGGQPAQFFYDGVLRRMKESNFHPSKGLGIVDGGKGTNDLEGVRAAEQLRALSSDEWQALTPVGSLQIEPIAFRRGRAVLNVQSERELDALARRLQSFPRFYLTVRGHARAEGDAAANLQLAEDRARTAAEYIGAKGISPDRIRSLAVPPSTTSAAAQSVSFELAQVPY